MSYGSDCLIAVMKLNIVLFSSLLRVVFYKQHHIFIADISLMIKKQQKSM